MIGDSHFYDLLRRILFGERFLAILGSETRIEQNGDELQQSAGLNADETPNEESQTIADVELQSSATEGTEIPEPEEQDGQDQAQALSASTDNSVRKKIKKEDNSGRSQQLDAAEEAPSMVSRGIQVSDDNFRSYLASNHRIGARSLENLNDQLCRIFSRDPSTLLSNIPSIIPRSRRRHSRLSLTARIPSIHTSDNAESRALDSLRSSEPTSQNSAAIGSHEEQASAISNPLSTNIDGAVRRKNNPTWLQKSVSETNQDYKPKAKPSTPNTLDFQDVINRIKKELEAEGLTPEEYLADEMLPESVPEANSSASRVRSEDANINDETVSLLDFSRGPFMIRRPIQHSERSGSPTELPVEQDHDRIEEPEETRGSLVASPSPSLEHLEETLEINSLNILDGPSTLQDNNEEITAAAAQQLERVTIINDNSDIEDSNSTMVQNAITSMNTEETLEGDSLNFPDRPSTIQENDEEIAASAAQQLEHVTITNDNSDIEDSNSTRVQNTEETLEGDSLNFPDRPSTFQDNEIIAAAAQQLEQVTITNDNTDVEDSNSTMLQNTITTLNMEYESDTRSSTPNTEDFQAVIDGIKKELEAEGHRPQDYLAERKLPKALEATNNDLNLGCCDMVGERNSTSTTDITVSNTSDSERTAAFLSLGIRSREGSEYTLSDEARILIDNQNQQDDLVSPRSSIASDEIISGGSDSGYYMEPGISDVAGSITPDTANSITPDTPDTADSITPDTALSETISGESSSEISVTETLVDESSDMIEAETN